MNHFYLFSPGSTAVVPAGLSLQKNIFFVSPSSKSRISWLYVSLFLVSWLLVAINSATAQIPSKQWDKTFGGKEWDRLYAMIPTSDGGYLLGGSSNSGITGDKSEESRNLDDYWVVKIDSDGRKQWDKTFGGTGLEDLKSIIPTADGGYILGGMSASGIGGDKTQENRGGSDYWIVKVNSEGNKQWDKTFGGDSEDYFTSIVATADGGYLLAGSSVSGVGGDKSAEKTGYWIVKITSEGTKQWDKAFDGGNFGRVIATSDGGYLLGGFTSSGVEGDKSEPSRGSFDYWIVKVDSEGNKQWDKTLGGDSEDYFTSMIATADGGYLLGGYSRSDKSGDKSENGKGYPDYNLDYWIVKIASDGSKQWDKTFGGGAWDELNTMIATTDGGYLLGGRGFNAREYDYWIVKITSDGRQQWDKAFGGTRSESLTSIIQAADGGFLLGGYSGSGPNGDKSEPSRGEDDFWIVKTTPDVTLPPVVNFYVNSAGPDFTGYYRDTYEADNYVSGGFPAPAVTGDVGNTMNHQLYHDSRQGGDFMYSFPTGNGTFRVTLHFNEPYYGNLVPGGTGSRKFKVNIEGVRKLTEYDIFAKAGGAMKAIQETFTVQVSDSILNIHFVRGSKGYALVSAIQVSTILPTARIATKQEVDKPFTQARLSPNPATDHLWVDLGLATDHILSTQITDIAGRMYQKNVHSLIAQEKQVEIPVGQIKTGLYLLKIETTGGTQILKFFKR